MPVFFKKKKSELNICFLVLNYLTISFYEDVEFNEHEEKARGFVLFHTDDKWKTEKVKDIEEV